MLTRVLPLPTLKVGKSSISLSRKIAGTVAAEAIENAKFLLRGIEKSDDPVAELEQIHSHLDLLEELEPQLEAHAGDLLEASEVLGGGVATGTSPLVELSLQTRALMEALEIAAPGADLSDVADVGKELAGAADDVAGDLALVKSRRVRLDSLAREATGIVMTRSDVDPHAVLESYEPPSHWTLKPEQRTTSSKAVADVVAGEVDTVTTNNFAEVNESLRRQARMHRAAARDTEREKRNRLKSERRKEIRERSKQIWGSK